MIKHVKLLALVLLAVTKLYAQQCDTAGYAKAYWFNGIQSSLTSKILPGPNGTLLLFGNIQLNYNQPSPKYVCYITMLNSRGTPLQSKIIEFNHDVLLYDASQSSDGNYFITGFSNNGTAGNDPWVAKVDADGNTLWSYGLGKPVGAFFRVVPTADGGCITVGRFAVNNTRDQHGNIVRAYNHGLVFRLDKTGKVLWGDEFYTSTEVEQVFEAKQLHDGSVVVSGVKNNSPYLGPGSDYFIMKLADKDGSVLWQKESSIYFGQITETGNGNLLFRQSNFLYFVSAANGTMSYAVNFFLPPAYSNNYDMHYAGSFADKQDLYYDYVDKKSILLFKMDGYDSIAWMSDVQSANSFGTADNPFSVSIQQNGSPGIYLVGGLASAGLGTQDSSTNEENTFLLKTGLNGQSPCTSPLQVPVTFTTEPSPLLSDFKWDDFNSLGFSQGRPLSANTIFPGSGSDCYVTSCCRDTTVNITVNVCRGSSYALPGGKVITEPGNYAAILKRSTGCDSIIFITVNMVPPPQPALGDDTCFISAPQITLHANAQYADSYTWQDGSTDSVFTASAPGTYIVRAKNACGIYPDTAVIFPNCNFPVFVPSAFTPNGDGLNDVFRIVGLQGQQLVDFSIYNRWGQLVFRTKDPAKGWDGTVNGKRPATETFVYIIRYITLQGINKSLQGTVSLIR